MFREPGTGSVGVPLLRTLGSVSLLEHEHQHAAPVDIQQKRLALLTYLARSNPSMPVRRDLLLALFWPESDEQRARAVLRQAMMALRRHLGVDAVRTWGDEEVGLSPNAVRCDANAFEAACSAGDDEVACALYTGDFLAGFHATGVAAEFEEWVSAERRGLQQQASAAARRLTDRAASEGRTGDAVGWARRAVAIEPGSEQGVARLIAALDAHGDRAAALATYRELEERLQREFGATPAPETRALIRALHQRPTPGALQRIATAPPPPPAYLADAPANVAVPSARNRRPHAGLLAAGAVALLMAWGGFREPVDAPRATAVAIVPFRVHVSDTTLTLLSEGIVELLSTRMAGVEAIPVVDAGRSIAAWRRASRTTQGSAQVRRAFAEATDAGRILEGSITERAGRVVLAASLAPVAGQPSVSASVEGPTDSLPRLVDALAGQLLGLDAGVGEEQVAGFSRVPFPALRSFLAGRADFRRGRMEGALTNYRAAVAADSTFALAGLELARTTQWRGTADDMARGIAIARRHLDALSAADRTFLDAFASERRSAPDMFAEWSAAVVAHPDRADMWYHLGETWFHWGRLAGMSDALERAEVAFYRGWALDSAGGAEWVGAPLVAETVTHMVELAHLRGDSAGVRGLASRLLAAAPASERADYVRWHLAQIDGPAAIANWWQQAKVYSQHTTMQVILFIDWTGMGGDQMGRAREEDVARLLTFDPGYQMLGLYTIAMNAGRPGDWMRSGADVAGRAEGLRRDLTQAMWWIPDSAGAARAARALGVLVDAQAARRSVDLDMSMNICSLGLWRALQGEPGAGLAADRLRGLRVPGLSPSDSGRAARHRQLCAALIDAGVAVAAGQTDGGASVALADSLARTWVSQVSHRPAVPDANLIVARLWEGVGQPERALAAVRRRSHLYLVLPRFMTAFLREEGRLAAATGDTAGAVRAWQHYLVLRPDAEPAAEGEVRWVREALRGLRRES